MMQKNDGKIIYTFSPRSNITSNIFPESNL